MTYGAGLEIMATIVLARGLCPMEGKFEIEIVTLVERARLSRRAMANLKLVLGSRSSYVLM